MNRKTLCKIIPLLILLFLVIDAVKCQPPANEADFNKPIQILPPSPNAASLGKYGGIELGLSKGTANVTIPLFDYKSSNINLPISLNYISSGFKVDEIASRVGMGWALNAGGVITRTVYGSVDETSVRLAPLIAPSGKAMLDLMKAWAGEGQLTGGVGPYGTYDNQPDIFNFNFNGYSGSFILESVSLSDGTRVLQPVLLSHSDLKIERAVSGNEEYAFKFTTGEGVQYLFKTPDGSSTYNATISGPGCGYLYDQNVATAYYLDKVIHPNNDVITLTYSRLQYHYLTSVSETMYTFDPASASVYCPQNSEYSPRPEFLNNICFNELQTSGALLEQISSSTGGRLSFEYIGRSDYNDKLLSSIKIYQPGKNTPFKTFSLVYQYPTTSSYPSPNNSPELSARPFLMSLSEMDRNGVSVKKHSFLYNDFESLPSRLSFAKDHWGYFNGKNNSTSIPIPTDEKFKYYLPLATANREADPNYAQKGMLSSVSYPTGGRDSLIYEGNVANIKVDTKPQSTTTAISAVSTGTLVTVYSSVINVAYFQNVAVCGARSFASPEDTTTALRIRVLDLSNNIFLDKGLLEQGSNSINENLLLQPGMYRIELTVAGPNASGSACLIFKPGNVVTEYKDVNVGGVRVARVYTYDGIKSTPSLKRYFYDVPAFSNYLINYQKELKVYSICPIGSEGEVVSGREKCKDVIYRNFFTMYSNSIFNIYQNGNASVSYSKVTESFGENFENGGIEHHFTAVPDEYPGQVENSGYSGDEIIGAPSSNLDFRNGRETYQLTFRKNGSAIIPLKEVYTNYKEDSRMATSYRAYVANRKYVYPCPVPFDDPIQDQWRQFDCMSYYIYRSWVYPETIRTLTYAEDGTHYTEDVSISEYANPLHALPTKVTTVNSDNSANITYNYYPSDIVLTGEDELGRQALVSKHILSPVLKQDVFKDLAPVASFNLRYKVFPSGLVLPASKWYKLKANTSWQNNEVFYKYNLLGKLLEHGQENNFHTAYLWGYNNNYPVAEVKGASFSEISSFVDQAVLDNPSSDQQLNTELNKIRLGLNSSIASVTTQTYDPLIGMTSQTDENSRTTYYDYDDFSRLRLIRDQNHKILKKLDYGYADKSVFTAAALNKVVDDYRQFEPVHMDFRYHPSNTTEYTLLKDTRQIFKDGVLKLPYQYSSRPFTFYSSMEIALRENYINNTFGKFCFMDQGYSFECRIKMPRLAENGNHFYVAIDDNFFVMFERTATSIDIIGYRDFDGHQSGSDQGGANFSRIPVAGPDGFDSFQTIKMSVDGGYYRVFFNGVKKIEFPRAAATQINRRFLIGIAFGGNAGEVDYIDLKDVNDTSRYREDFTTPHKPVRPKLADFCHPTASCEAEFVKYFNQQMGTAYTLFSEVKQVYEETTLQPLDICN